MSKYEQILLPTRDYLRQMIGLSAVKKSHIKDILRNRGVFFSSEEKDRMAPVLIKSGISPAEFIELKESVQDKEHSKKTKTRTIPWESDKHLSEAIRDDFDPGEFFDDRYGTCVLHNISGLTVDGNNPDRVSIDYSIERNDLVKNWGENRSVYDGKLEMRKEGDRLLVVSLAHTAPETKLFGEKLSSALIKSFKNDGHIDQDADITIIRFTDFNNSNRIKFLKELTQNGSQGLAKFSDTVDVNFAPDNTKPTVPPNLEWMKEKIDRLKMTGKSLHSTFFVTDEDLFPYIMLFGLECKYEVQGEGYSGDCRILCEFSDRRDDSSSELVLNLIVLHVQMNNSDLKNDDIKKEIVNSFENSKIRLYDRYRNTDQSEETAEA